MARVLRAAERLCANAWQDLKARIVEWWSWRLAVPPLAVVTGFAWTERVNATSASAARIAAKHFPRAAVACTELVPRAWTMQLRIACVILDSPVSIAPCTTTTAILAKTRASAMDMGSVTKARASVPATRASAVVRVSVLRLKAVSTAAVVMVPVMSTLIPAFARLRGRDRIAELRDVLPSTAPYARDTARVWPMAMSWNACV